MDSGCCWGRRGQIQVQKDKRNTSLSPRGSSREQREHLGSAPSHLTYPSKTSPSEPRLSLISKANVGTAPFPVPGLFYLSPGEFPIPAKSAPLQSPLPSQKKCQVWSRGGKAQTPKPFCTTYGWAARVLRVQQSWVRYEKLDMRLHFLLMHLLEKLLGACCSIQGLFLSYIIGMM